MLENVAIAPNVRIALVAQILKNVIVALDVEKNA